MQIFIPTIGRVDGQYTWDQLPRKWQKYTTLVCPMSERDQHVALGRNVAPHPTSCKGIAEVRQFRCSNKG